MGKIIFILVVAIAGLGAYVYFNPELLAHIPQLRESMGIGAPTTEAYKWQDANGGWHYTTEPPPDGVSYERVEVRHDTNVLPPPPGINRN